MLYVTDTNGQKITSARFSYRENNSRDGVLVTIQANVIESDASLIGRWATASLNWNDSASQAVQLGRVSLDALGGTWTISASRRLQPGNYVVVLKAQNYRAPVEDTVSVNFFVSVSASKDPYSPPTLIFGPILPRDGGFPNPQQWEFNIDYDISVLESSVKMLLLTSVGDRVMLPTYGTKLRKLLFESNIPATESLIREELTSALSIWEPRVSLAGLETSRDPNSRKITLDMTLVSKLNKQAFSTSVAFVR